MSGSLLRVLALGSCLAAAGRAAAATPFDHAEHLPLVDSCFGCHPGGTESGATMWPVPQTCAECHDGYALDRVEWSAPALRASNLRFDHSLHAEDLACADCHAGAEDTAMPARRPDASTCLDCHGEDAAHLAQPSEECARCHLPLSEAAGLSREQIAGFPEPPSHAEPGFSPGRGHGVLACPAEGSRTRVAASCTTCHAREFCLVCHVDAPERDAIQALASDERSLALHAELQAPADHAASEFLQRHGHDLESEEARCAACHTRESCEVCHVATPEVAAALPGEGLGRGTGALVSRKAPAYHDVLFRTAHGAAAAADPMECAACHARQDCLECHLADPAVAPPGYHPVDFLARHPASAYARETSCGDCHSPGSFCSTCHESAGLVGQRPALGAGYHDAKDAFLFGHGPAARRSLESCVTCHAERDCLACHSAVTGRRFNPHGPDFDADQLRSRATQMCTVCHGARIPGGE